MKTKLDRDEAIQWCRDNDVSFEDDYKNTRPNGWSWRSCEGGYKLVLESSVETITAEDVSRAKVLAVLSKDEPILNDDTVTAYKAKDGTLFESREERDEYDTEKPLNNMRGDIQEWLEETEETWTDHYDGSVVFNLLASKIVEDRDHVLEMLQVDIEKNMEAKLEASRIMVGDRDAEIVALKEEIDRLNKVISNHKKYTWVMGPHRPGLIGDPEGKL